MRALVLRWQIENPAHRLDDKGRLMGCSSVQQHRHRRLEHLFYNATTQRFHNILLVRAQIAQASVHDVFHCDARPQNALVTKQLSPRLRNKEPVDCPLLYWSQLRLPSYKEEATESPQPTAL